MTEEEQEKEYCMRLCIRGNRVETCGVILPANRLCPNVSKHVCDG